jgi:3-hydroxyacyl-CoA dehydrogenase
VEEGADPVAIDKAIRLEGGPFRYIDHIGAPRIMATLESLEKIYGKRFSTPQILKDILICNRQKLHVKEINIMCEALTSFL